MAGNLTSADAVMMLGITGLYPVPLKMEMWVSDNPFDFDEINVSEIVSTLDGKLTGGYIYEPVAQTITFEANSPSVTFINDWLQAMRTDQTLYRAFGNITLPDYGKNITLTNGILMRGKPAPGSRKILSPFSYRITWETAVTVGV